MEKLLQKGKNFLKKIEDKKKEYKDKREARKKSEEELKQKSATEEVVNKPEIKKATLFEKLEQEYRKAKAANETPQKNFKKKFSSKSLRSVVEALLEVSTTLKRQSESIDFNIYHKDCYYPPSPILRDFIKRQGNIDFSTNVFQEFINDQMEPKKPNKQQSVIFCIAVVGFHHKKGPTVRLLYFCTNIYEEERG